MVDLSIIIISYNTAKITVNCLESVIKALEQSNKVAYEIIVIDNASTDNSQSQILNVKSQNHNLNLKTIFNEDNVGFAKANNQGVKQAHGKYILFLNSDVIINNLDFNDVLEYFKKDKKVGALTIRINLKNNGIDPASHRGFPTIWRSFCYFSGLERWMTRTNLLKKIFGGYHLLDKDLKKIHEIDSPSGAFFLIAKKMFNEIGGFDESFFMYGEDLDLAYRIKSLGLINIYYPKWQATHLKYQSGLEKDLATKKKIKKHFYEAMEIFYKKHYAPKTFWLFNQLIYILIKIRSFL